MTTATIIQTVATALPGFTVRFVAGGAEARAALAESGLLANTEDASPLGPEDLLEIAGLRVGFVVLGYHDAVPVGYIVGQIFHAGRGVFHCFVNRVWSAGQPAWSRAAHEFLEEVARRLGCDAVAATVPERLVPFVKRRYHYDVAGVYVVKRISKEAES
jgi:hypothetical protein